MGHTGRDNVQKITQELVDANIIDAPVDPGEKEGWYRRIHKALIERRKECTTSDQHSMFQQMSSMGVVEASNIESVNAQVLDQTVNMSPGVQYGPDLHPPEDHDVCFPEQAAPENTPENTPEDMEGQWMSLGWDCAGCKRLSPELCKDSHDADIQVDISLLQRSLLYATPQEFSFKDGEWCNNTSSAVEWFQQRHSLVGEPGVVDNECWEKLGGEVKKRDENERKKKQEKQRANKEREIKKKNQAVESSAQLEVLLAECHRELDAPSSSSSQRYSLR